MTAAGMAVSSAMQRPARKAGLVVLSLVLLGLVSESSGFSFVPRPTVRSAAETELRPTGTHTRGTVLLGGANANKVCAGMNMNRNNFFQRIASLVATVALPSADAFAMTAPSGRSVITTATTATTTPTRDQRQVAYRSLSLPMDASSGRVSIPVACWYPASPSPQSSTATATANGLLWESTNTLSQSVTYQHKISVRKIAQLLARWNFVPSIVSREFSLQPTSSSTILVTDGKDQSLPRKAPIVVLAHGFLGSRFDLSHLGEALASQGFVVVAPEYPESLSASYDPEGLDRSVITTKLVAELETTYGIQPTSYGIVGHSLGTRTCAQAPESWTRVMIAGFPNIDTLYGSVLCITSMNDGAVNLARRGGRSAIPSRWTILEEESDVITSTSARLPNQGFLLLDRPDAPNHISFLAESVNEAMMDFLSPLLPVAQAFSIPVLDFDRYQLSRDSQPTAAIVVPLVTRFLKQQMVME